MISIVDHRGVLRDPEDFIASPIGRAAWILYAGATRCFHALYDFGVLRKERASIPLVSIGGLTFGGSGKTPVTRWIARGLHRRGWRVAILSRGYGGSGTKESRLVSSETASAPRDGDEATLLARTCREAAVVVGAHRAQSARVAQEAGATVGLLDDGHQHRRLWLDCDVLLWDARTARAFERTPRGLGLREPWGGLERADFLLLVDRGEGTPLPPSTISRGDVARVLLKMHAAGGSPHPERVHVLSGIADPAAFERGIAAKGITVTGATRFPDHYGFRAADAAEVLARARSEGAQAIAMTAKDLVRASSLFDGGGLPIVDYDLEASSEEEERMLDAIESRIRREDR